MICGDNLHILKRYPDNFFDSVVCDPPYGLGKEPNAAEVLKDWIEKGYHEVKAKGGGFMNKSWDSFVPQPNFWKEVFRVLKPGGHLLAFGGTRTYDWMLMSLRLAGFEIRDQLQYIYGSGFPKSMDISKAIDKRAGAEREVIGKGTITGARVLKTGMDDQAGYTKGRTFSNPEPVQNLITESATDAAKQWDGWGTALKPAYEPICLARKPIDENTVTENVLARGTGAINIDDCRIAFSGDKDFNSATFGRGTDIMGGNFVGATHSTGETNIEANPKGRWPSNLLLSHHPDCELIGTKQIKGSLIEKPSECKTGTGGTGSTFAPMQGKRPSRGHGDSNNQEIVEHWNCHGDCPIKILDEQSGVLKSGDMNKEWGYNTKSVALEGGSSGKTKIRKGDTGGASRFFYCAKASRSERNKGLENYEFTQNNHPTVKPVKLMMYLVRLITPTGGRCLDPFNGSGTTGIACKLTGVHYTGIEQDEHNCQISKARIAAWIPEREDYDYQLKLAFDDGSND